MPWLAELVESSEGSLDVLPVQCLCEFLLHEPSDLANDVDVEDIFGADRSKRKQVCFDVLYHFILYVTFFSMKSLQLACMIIVK